MTKAQVPRAARMVGINGKNGRPWGWTRDGQEYGCCQGCGTTWPHRAKGLCAACYDREYAAARRAKRSGAES
jgi:hypothetical protein